MPAAVHRHQGAVAAQAQPDATPHLLTRQSKQTDEAARAEHVLSGECARNTPVTCAISRACPAQCLGCLIRFARR